jgi:hypothetical protein
MINTTQLQTNQKATANKLMNDRAKLLGELKGTFFPCKAVVPSTIEHKRGCISNN